VEPVIQKVIEWEKGTEIIFRIWHWYFAFSGFAKISYSTARFLFTAISPTIFTLFGIACMKATELESYPFGTAILLKAFPIWLLSNPERFTLPI
jgi:hypothetical protein